MPRQRTTPKESDEEVKLSKPEETEEIEEAKDPEEKKETPKESDDSVDIIIVNDPSIKDYTGAIFVRQYTREMHGDNFEELADMFCTKKPRRGIYIKVHPTKIGNLEVRYREKLDYDKKLDDQDPNAPIVDKTKVFTNKEEAVRFGTQKYQSTVVVSRVKAKKPVDD